MRHRRIKRRRRREVTTLLNREVKGGGRMER